MRVRFRAVVLVPAALALLLGAMGDAASAQGGAGESFFALASLSDEVAAIYTQNLDESQTADIEAAFYNQDGSAPVVVHRAGVRPLANTVFGMGHIAQLVDGDYGVFIGADRRVASSEVQFWKGGPVAAVSQLRPAQEIVIPLVVRNWAGQYSSVAVQNIDVNQRVTVDVELFEQGSSIRSWEQSFEIGPGTSIAMDFEDDSTFVGLSEHFLGSMRIVSRSGLEVTAQSLIHQPSSDRAIYGFEGLPATAAGSALYAPLIRNGWYGTTGINVANPNSHPVEVTVTFHGTNQPDNLCRNQVAAQGPVSVPGSSAVNFWQGAGGGSGLPEECFGSAVITSSGGDVLAIVNDSVIEDGLIQVSAAYVALPLAEAAYKLALPFVPDDVGHDRWNTGVQIMNVSASQPAAVTIGIIDADGDPVPHRAEFDRVVQPGTATGLVIVPGNLGDVFQGQVGTAIITSNQPVLSIVNTFPVPYGARDSSTYNALNAD